MSYDADVRDSLAKLWQLRPFTERELTLIQLAYVPDECFESHSDPAWKSWFGEAATKMLEVIEFGLGAVDGAGAEDSDTNEGGS